MKIACLLQSSYKPSQSLNYPLRISGLQNEDYVLTTDIEIEEIEAAIAKLKQGKSAGPDGILSGHIIYSGPIFRVWL